MIAPVGASGAAVTVPDNMKNAQIMSAEIQVKPTREINCFRIMRELFLVEYRIDAFAAWIICDGGGVTL